MPNSKLGKGVERSFKGVILDLPPLLPVPSHWPELSHGQVSRCKGKWNLFYLVFIWATLCLENTQKFSEKEESENRCWGL